MEKLIHVIDCHSKKEKSIKQ